jgi:hypothetical protein
LAHARLSTLVVGASHFPAAIADAGARAAAKIVAAMAVVSRLRFMVKILGLAARTVPRAERCDWTNARSMAS